MKAVLTKLNEQQLDGVKYEVYKMGINYNAKETITDVIFTNNFCFCTGR